MGNIKLGSTNNSVRNINDLDVHIDVWQSIYKDTVGYLGNKLTSEEFAKIDSHDLQFILMERAFTDDFRNDGKKTLDQYSALNNKIFLGLFEEKKIDKKLIDEIRKYFRFLSIFSENNEWRKKLDDLLKEMSEKGDMVKILPDDKNYQAVQLIDRARRIFLKRRQLFYSEVKYQLLNYLGDHKGSSQSPAFWEVFYKIESIIGANEDFSYSLIAELFDSLKENKPILLKSGPRTASPVLKSQSNYKTATDFRKLSRENDREIKDLTANIRSRDDFGNTETLEKLSELNRQRSVLNLVVSEQEKNLNLGNKIVNSVVKFKESIGSDIAYKDAALFLTFNTGLRVGQAAWNKITGFGDKNNDKEIALSIVKDLAQVGTMLAVSAFFGPAVGVAASSFLGGIINEKKPDPVLKALDEIKDDISNLGKEISENHDRLTRSIRSLPEIIITLQSREDILKQITELKSEFNSISDTLKNIEKKSYIKDLSKWNEKTRTKIQLLICTLWCDDFVFDFIDNSSKEYKTKSNSVIGEIIDNYKKNNSYQRFDRTLEQIQKVTEPVISILKVYYSIRSKVFAIMRVQFAYFDDTERDTYLGIFKDYVKEDNSLQASILYLESRLKFVMGIKNYRLYLMMKSYWNDLDNYNFMKGFCLVNPQSQKIIRYDYEKRQLVEINGSVLGNYINRIPQFFIHPDKQDELAKFSLINAQIDDRRRSFEMNVALDFDDCLYVDNNTFQILFLQDNQDTNDAMYKVNPVYRIFNGYEEPLYPQGAGPVSGEKRKCYLETFLSQLTFEVDRGKCRISLDFDFSNSITLSEMSLNSWIYVRVADKDSQGKVKKDGSGKPTWITEKITIEEIFNSGNLRASIRYKQLRNKDRFGIGIIAFDKDLGEDSTFFEVAILSPSSTAFQTSKDEDYHYFDYRIESEALRSQKITALYFDSLKFFNLKSYLLPGQVLKQNEFIGAERGDVRLVHQMDGNLVLYQIGNGGCVGNDYDQKIFEAKWSSKTNGKYSNRLIMQKDGNLVLESGNVPVWDSSHYKASNTGEEVGNNSGNYLIMRRPQDAVAVEIVDKDGKKRWLSDDNFYKR